MNKQLPRIVIVLLGLTATRSTPPEEASDPRFGTRLDRGRMRLLWCQTGSKLADTRRRFCKPAQNLLEGDESARGT